MKNTHNQNENSQTGTVQNSTHSTCSHDFFDIKHKMKEADDLRRELVVKMYRMHLECAIKLGELGETDVNYICDLLDSVLTVNYGQNADLAKDLLSENP